MALTAGTNIMIDPTADGYGWFVDPKLPMQPAAGRMDLLTVLEHELGHVLGLADIPPALEPNDLMDTTLATGVRRLPSAKNMAELRPVPRIWRRRPYRRGLQTCRRCRAATAISVFTLADVLATLPVPQDCRSPARR